LIGNALLNYRQRPVVLRYPNEALSRIGIRCWPRSLQVACFSIPIFARSRPT